MNRSIRITVCSMVAAVDAVLMFLTGVIPGGTLVLPALAGLPLIMVVIEFGKAWAWMAYLVVSLLSALIAADKDAVLFFILFFGSYSILKAEIEKRPSRAVRILLKLVFFNAAAIASFYLGIYLLGVPQESFTVFGVYLPWLYLLLGNIVFIIYDYAVSLLRRWMANPTWTSTNSPTFTSTRSSRTSCCRSPKSTTPILPSFISRTSPGIAIHMTSLPLLLFCPDVKKG